MPLHDQFFPRSVSRRPNTKPPYDPILMHILSRALSTCRSRIQSVSKCCGDASQRGRMLTETFENRKSALGRRLEEPPASKSTTGPRCTTVCNFMQLCFRKSMNFFGNCGHPSPVYTFFSRSSFRNCCISESNTVYNCLSNQSVKTGANQHVLRT